MLRPARLGFLIALLCLLAVVVAMVGAVSSHQVLAQALDGVPADVGPPATTGAALTDHTLELTVNQSSDDVEEDIATRHVARSGTDLELGQDDDGAQAVGLRFTTVTIPQGSLIVEAYLEFTADETGSEPTDLVIHGQASDDADTFPSDLGVVTKRPKTSAAVNWDAVPAWGEVGGKHRSPDLAAIVQEISSRQGWRSGNAMAFVITGTGRRTADAWDGNSALAPRLLVTYQVCYSLTVSVEPAGSGAIVVQPPPNCGDGRYVEGTEVELKAVPAADYDFVNWNGDAAGSSNPKTVSMDADMVIAAIFSDLPPGSLMKVVGQSSDDAEEAVSSGVVSLKSTDLELGEDFDGAQIVGLRFEDLQIPREAAISQAYLEFTADREEDEAASLLFRGQDADDPPTFVRNRDDISDRRTTSASVAWTKVPAWTRAGEIHRTPDLSSIVQEIVNRPGWSAGNSLVLAVTGSGQRPAVSYDGALRDGQPDWAPRLYVIYAGEPACYSLITAPSPNNGGEVHASPPPNCAGGKYLEGTEVQLTATPAGDWGFAGWSGDSEGTANPTTVTLNRPKVVTANFSQDCYGLSTGLQPPGSGTVEAAPAPGCEGGRYLIGTEVQLAADPKAGYLFAAWSGDLSGGENPITVTMAGPRSVTANFATTCYSLTLNLVPTAGGTVDALPPPNCGLERYVPGTLVQLTAQPAEDYQFAAWSGDVTGVEAAAEIAVDSSKMVTATFSADCFSLTTAVEPPGSGSLAVEPAPDCAGDMYAAGTQVRLTAEPAGGKVFANWSGDATGSTNPLTVTLDTDLSLTANFADWCHLLSVSVNPMGGGTVDAFPPSNCEGAPGETRYTPGTQVQLTARPALGKTFRNWSGHLAGKDNPIVVTLDADRSIVANFSLPAYLPLVLRDG